MKFKVDENLPAELAADIKAAGHDAATVFDQGMIGDVDSAIMSHVQSEGRVILTMDKGIADVRAYPPAQYPGIVLFRPGNMGRSQTLAFVRQHLPALLQSALSGHLFVVSDSGIRKR